MQTFDVLIAPGPPSNSVSCFLFLLLLFLLSLSSPMGRDHSGKQERRTQPLPATLLGTPRSSQATGLGQHWAGLL